MRNKIKFITVAGLVSLTLSLCLGLALADDSTPNTSTTDTTHPPGLTHCTTDSTGKQTCVRVDGGINSSVNNLKPIIKKLDDAKAKSRELRIQAIGKIYQNQIGRAQQTINSITNITVRIQAQEAKLPTTTSVSDLANLNALITLDQNESHDAVTALADVKTKAAAIQATLSAANTDTTNMTDVGSDTITTLKQEITDFQASVKTLKEKLNIVYKSLQQTVKLLRSLSQPATTTNSTSTTNAGDQENK